MPSSLFNVLHGFGHEKVGSGSLLRIVEVNKRMREDAMEPGSRAVPRASSPRSHVRKGKIGRWIIEQSQLFNFLVKREKR